MQIILFTAWRKAKCVSVFLSLQLFFNILIKAENDDRPLKNYDIIIILPSSSCIV